MAFALRQGEMSRSLSRSGTEVCKAWGLVSSRAERSWWWVAGRRGDWEAEQVSRNKRTARRLNAWVFEWWVIRCQQWHSTSGESRALTSDTNFAFTWKTMNTFLNSYTSFRAALQLKVTLLDFDPSLASESWAWVIWSDFEFPLLWKADKSKARPYHPERARSHLKGR